MNLFKKLFQKKYFSNEEMDTENILTRRDNYLFTTFGGAVTFDNLVNQNQNNDRLIELFNTLSEVHTPIKKFYEPAKQVIADLMIKGANGKYKYADGHWLKPIIDNYINTQFDKHIIYKLLLGNVFVNAFSYGTVSTGIKNKKLQELILIPPQYTLIKSTQNTDFRQNKLQEYRFYNPGFESYIQFLPEEILHIKNNNPLFSSASYLYGISSLVSCAKNFRSIESGYGAKVSLYEHGPRVVITGKNQGEFAAMSIQSNETIQELQTRINTAYGMQSGQFRVMITDIPLDVQVIGDNIANLQINENNQSDVQKIGAALDIDPLVFTDSQATFSNKDLALEDFYNGSFKRLIDGEFAQLSLFLQKFDPNIKLVPNYQNIPRIVKSQKAYSDELLKKVYAGLMTRNEYFEYTNERTVNLPEFNQYMTFYNGIWYPINSIPVKNGQQQQ